MRQFAALALMTVSLVPFTAASSNELGGPSGGVRLSQAKAARVCVQVISCGTKAGKRNEYPTPCAAQDDGTTDIAPKTGATCDDPK